MNKKKMLVVVDYQNDFVNGALGFPGAELLDEGIAAKVKAYSEAGHTILATRDTHDPNYLWSREGKALPVAHCVADSDGWELYGKTRWAVCQAIMNGVADGEKYGYTEIFDKYTFGSDPQDLLRLREMFNPDEIEFVGLVTNMCVIANVCCFQAAWPNAQIVVDASLVASFDPDLHKKTLDVMEGMQVQVINREEV